MATFRTGYFRLAPAEIGATLIFPPSFVGAIRCEELTLWARAHGFEQIAYIPAAHLERPRVEH